MWMIYGASGYSGELIARAAKARGMAPILAGRTSERVVALARDLSLPYRVFPLDDELPGHLRDVKVVLHCAGPFSATSARMVSACLASRVHYLDITGEIDVFEQARARMAEARQAGVVICPGVGFDVIPTDCLAAVLHEALPDATQLSLGFDSRSSLSPGTAKTSVEALSQPGKVRRGGTIVDVPLGHESRRIDFGDGEKLAATVPWGDVSTAFHTTGIPDIQVFIPVTPARLLAMRAVRHLRPVLALGPVQSFLKKRAGQASGPSAEKRAARPTYVWGEVTSAAGVKKTARIRTANGYDVTVTGALAAVEYLLSTQTVGGYYTPARLLGPDLITKLPGSGPLELS